MEPGDLVAAVNRYTDQVWLFKVKRTTEQRAYVDLVEGVTHYSPPTSWRGDSQYLDKAKCIPVRDMDHFGRIKTARAQLKKSVSDIESTARSKTLAAQARYDAAIA